ncbi:MAG: DUF1328 domain-containing protein [Gammaproteobacteria bacterium]|nr:DUF1328 domain-containing protein [Gammaproteobacteria bacterium]NVK89138.1 DUF1328 domain-containing protein [Gammaproteobacteria bacterium]
MLNTSILLLIIAIIAGVLGFTNISGAATLMAKVMFFIFLILWVVTLVRRRTQQNI